MSLVLRKPAFCICENKDADQLRSNSAVVFAIWIVQSLFYLNPKSQDSSNLLWLYSPVCVGPGRKPERWFSHNEPHMIFPKLFKELYFVTGCPRGWVKSSTDRCYRFVDDAPLIYEEADTACWVSCSFSRARLALRLYKLYAHGCEKTPFSDVWH